MKRQDLVRRLVESGCVLVRHGGRHDWYRNPRTGMCPRHTEVNENLARHILKKLKG
jgi:mRNA interferase HicA